MAAELKLAYGTSGVTVYAAGIRNAAGQVWSTVAVAFEAWTLANIANYVVAMPEQSTSAFYVGNFPTAIVAAGAYAVVVKLQAGGSPANTDTTLASGTVNWDGAKEIALPDVNTTTLATNTRAILALPAVAPAASGGLPTANASNQIQVDFTQVLPTPRLLTSSTADNTITAADAAWAAIAAGPGQKGETSTTTYVIKTPFGTPTRSFTISPAITTPTTLS